MPDTLIPDAKSSFALVDIVSSKSAGSRYWYRTARDRAATRSVQSSSTLVRAGSAEPLAIKLADEIFVVSREDGLAYLSHERWSLVGQGDDLYAAILDLVSEIECVKDSLASLPSEELAPDAQALLKFAESFLS